ncbi:MAG: histidine phosphatase family protein [Chloroflexi bacterium]|nr:histidine phosphatase family protein [Chloroflexota bacterium]
MQLYFIRHGQSANNANWDKKGENAYERSSDPHLTELGNRQAQALAAFIASTQSDSDHVSVGGYRHSVNITHLYSSLMIRAIQTGTILSETLGIPLYGLPDAHEIGGVYLEREIDGVSTVSFEHGVTSAYLQENYPHIQHLQPIHERGWWQGGREDPDASLSRAERLLQYLRNRHLGSGHKVAVVTHGGFFNSMMRVLFSINTEELENRNLPTWFSFCNCAITRLDLVNDRVELTYHNRTSFMEDELVTC